MKYGLCGDCEFMGTCRMVQEESYEVGGKETIVGVVKCDHYVKRVD